LAQDPFDLIWLSAFLLGCLSLPIVLGLLAVLTDRE
jgi:hypothetical protein